MHPAAQGPQQIDLSRGVSAHVAERDLQGIGNFDSIAVQMRLEPMRYLLACLHERYC